MPEVHLVGVTRIWDAGAHNAFTDLIRWRDRWYCVFREGDDHIGGHGSVRVLTSDAGDRWTSAALIDEPGVDLRDPKLSVTPEGRLMIVAGGSVYDDAQLVERQSRVITSENGTTWDVPARVLDEGEWLWRVTWHDGVAYGVTYNPGTAPDWTLSLVRSPEGRRWTRVGELAVPGKPNETTLRVLDDGEMLALVRREAGDRHAWLGRSQAPYRDWTWTTLGHRLGGPNMVVLPDGRLIAAGRGLPGPATVVASLTRDGAYTPRLTLPSGGDTGYPGLVLHDDTVWSSYYSSHEQKASIYLARIAVA